METKAEYQTEQKIDLSHLARLMLRWEGQRRQLDELEAAIRDTVLQLGKTQTVGNVRATYSNPRNSYDYEAAFLNQLLDLEGERQEALEEVAHRHMSTVTDWRAACQEAGIDPIITLGEGPGSVSIKLLT